VLDLVARLGLNDVADLVEDGTERRMLDYKEVFGSKLSPVVFRGATPPDRRQGSSQWKRCS
jgi:hypothetical protein